VLDFWFAEIKILLDSKLYNIHFDVVSFDLVPLVHIAGLEAGVFVQPESNT
jgi:hypothetical protein